MSMSKEYQAFLGLFKKASGFIYQLHVHVIGFTMTATLKLSISKLKDENMFMNSLHHKTCIITDAIKTGFSTTKPVITHLQKDYCQ